MIFGPFNLLFFWLTSAISLGILGGGAYFIWGWSQGILTSIGFLVSGVLMVLFSIMGRPLMMVMLGKNRPASSPDAAPRSVVHKLTRDDGSVISVEELGLESGPTLIFTHGLSLNSTIWNYVKQDLSSRYRLLIWDLPGFGRSTTPKGRAYTMEMLAESLHDVIRFAGDGPVVLAGHSLGGMVTLTYCRLFREELAERVAGIVLAQTSYTNPVKTAMFAPLLTALQWPVLQPLCYLMIWLSPLVWVMNVQNYLSGMAHLNCHLTGYAGAETPAQLDFAAHYTVTSSPATTGRALLAMFAYDATDVLPSISVPVLVVTGDHDLVTLREAGEVIHRGIPASERSELAPSGHLGLIEQYKTFNERVGGWAAACLDDARISRQTLQRNTA
jgi:pimeloyl-ACP methyl ester carboxylesterase